METLTLLLIFLTVSGSSFVLQHRGTVAEVGVSEMKTEQLRDDLTMKDNGDHRNGMELKLGEEILKDNGDEDRQKQEEEKESKLVAGISLDHEKGSEERGKEVEDIKNAKHEAPVEREWRGRTAINNLTPPINTTLRETSEIPLNQIITKTSNPPSSHRPVSATEVQASPAPPGEERSLLPTPAEALQQPGRSLMQLRGGQGLHSEQVNSVVQPQKHEFPPKMQTEAPKVSPVQSINQYLKAEANLTGESSQNKHVELAELWKTKAKTSLLNKQVFKSTEKQNVASFSQLQQEKLQNRGSKSKKVAEPKEKKKMGNRTPKVPKGKENFPPTHFPYFLDDYCPPECACYGRVVQCSDKGVDKVPYGIPYNARYILLMNNYIDSIQLDLLSEYVSMEFLVLSNNRLTNSATEGAFERIPALKRLYLDRNLLRSVPTDLPHSLEELRLDNNQLSMMSEAVWVRCPKLLVLSLSNNSLGNGSNPLPSAIFSPLSKLRTLNLDHNQLASIPLGLPLSIKELYLKGNFIEQFHGGVFTGISQLMVLDLSANRLTNKGLLSNPLLNATSLESLNLAGNKLKHVPRHLPRSLKTLNLESNLIAYIKKAALSTLKNLEHLGLARNQISKVAPGAFKELPLLHQLDLCHNSLRKVPRELPQALHAVALTHNRIQSVPSDAFCWGNKSLSRLVRVQLEDNFINMGKLNAQAFRCLRGFQVVHF